MNRNVLSSGFVVVWAMAFLIGCGGKKPDVEVAHGKVVVNLKTAEENRRPYLAVDVTFLCDANTDKNTLADLGGAKAKDAIIKALSDLEDAKVIMDDREAAMKDAADKIKKALDQAEIDTSTITKITFSAFTIQG